MFVHVDTTDVLHGRGLIATKRIRKSRTCLTESPSVFVSGTEVDSKFPVYDSSAWCLTAKVLEDDVRVQSLMDAFGGRYTVPWDATSDRQLEFLTDNTHWSAAEVHEIYTIVGAINLGGPKDSAGLYHMLNFINHSCDPNCKSIEENESNGTKRLEALRHIALGEECTISYIPGISTLATALRKARLMQDYAFQCACPRCV